MGSSTFNVFLLFIWLFVSKATSAARFTKVEGIVKESVRHRATTSRSAIDCLRKVCEDNTHCAASFHQDSKKCFVVFISSAPIPWTKSCFLTSVAEPGWVTFIPLVDPTSLELPSALWLFDNVCRGQNRGSKGGQLDSTTDGITWPADGPRGGGSGLKFARLGPGSRPVIQVRHEGSFLLDFTQPLTISVWVKTDNVAGVFPIIDGRNTDINSLAALLWFFDSPNLDQMHYAGTRVVQSVLNASFKFQWRYIVLVFTGGDNFTYYLNGTVWNLKVVKASVLARVNPDKINVGFRLPTKFFRGIIACFTIYERALPLSEVRELQTFC